MRIAQLTVLRNIIFFKIKKISEGDYTLEFTYGTDQQRIKTVLKLNDVPIKTKYFIGGYEYEIYHAENNRTRELCYFGADYFTGIYVKDSRENENKLYYVYKDHLGSFDRIANEAGDLIEIQSFDAWGNRRDLHNWQQHDTKSHLFDRGFTGHEHLDHFKIINMNGRLYDPVIARFFSADPYVQAPDFSQNYNRYSYCFNNPLSYTDHSGEFITWSLGTSGLSIGINLTPIGIPLGAGVNIGWGNGGGSAGIYGEIGYRVGGTGFGSGITASQSLDYSFRNESWSTSTSVGVYASLGVFNAGGNISYTYGNQGEWNWGISGGVNFFGYDDWGLGLNIGYGSGGLTLGLGGYYNPWAWKNNPTYEPDEWNDFAKGFDKRFDNNCYTYAIDEERKWHKNPGDIKEKRLQPKEITLDKVVEYAISDGRIKKPNFLNKLGFGKRDYYSILVNVQNEHDYHFYRQDKGGTWSAKNGNGSGGYIYQAKDANGKIVRNPMNISVPYQNGVMLLWKKVR